MKTILDYLEQSALKNKDKDIFVEHGKEPISISYGDFVLSSKKVASAIAGLNWGGELQVSPIAIFDNRNIGTLVSMFGVLYSGNYYIVLDSASPSERLQKIIDIIKPKCIIFEDKNKDKLDSLSIGEADTLNYSETALTKIDETYLEKKRAKMISTDPIYALFTSGSTGLPKGTILTHQNVMSYAEWFVNCFKIDEKTIFGNQTPFYFSMSVSDIFSTVMTGATMNIIPKSYFSFPIQLVTLINQQKINTIYWVPSALSIVANFKLFDFAMPLTLEKVLFAGEVMPNKQLNYWRAKLPNVMFANLFGPTETTDICTYYIVNRPFKDDESLPIGVHCDNCDTFIVNEGKLVTEVGQIGELYARGPFVASGYYDNEEKTKAAFVQNPLHNHYPELVYRTGDLVKLNEYGEYIYMGRKDFQIKHMGFRIELGEIETAASSIEKISSVVTIYDSSSDEIVLLYEGRESEDNVRELLKGKVPHYMQPNIIIKVKQMPFNANGKIDRAYLKNNYKSLM